MQHVTLASNVSDLISKDDFCTWLMLWSMSPPFTTANFPCSVRTPAHLPATVMLINDSSRTCKQAANPQASHPPRNAIAIMFSRKAPLALVPPLPFKTMQGYVNRPASTHTLPAALLAYCSYQHFLALLRTFAECSPILQENAHRNDYRYARLHGIYA